MSRTIISLALILNITQGTANRLKAVIPSTTRGSRTHSPLCTAGCWSSECSVLHLQLAAVWIIVCGLVVGVIGTFVWLRTTASYIGLNDLINKLFRPLGLYKFCFKVVACTGWAKKTDCFWDEITLQRLTIEKHVIRQLKFQSKYSKTKLVQTKFNMTTLCLITIVSLFGRWSIARFSVLV